MTLNIFCPPIYTSCSLLMSPFIYVYMHGCYKNLQIARFPEFKLAEGVDRTGVTTKILTCNCSLNLIIENKSRFYGLHIRPPTMDMTFSNLPLAFSNVSTVINFVGRGKYMIELYLLNTYQSIFRYQEKF